MNEDRVLMTGKGQFLLQKWSGTNDSGIVPCCDKVVILVDPAMVRSKGGIILTDNIQETQTLASTTGILVAIGPMAFVWDSDRARRWEGDKPEVGNRICFQRYAGQEYSGLDGQLYRVLQDRSVAGVMGMAEIGENEPADFLSVDNIGAAAAMGANFNFASGRPSEDEPAPAAALAGGAA